MKGDVVVVPFPFSDLTNTKKRPAFVLSDLHGDDVILCQITSQKVKDKHAIEISDSDFHKGSLSQISNIRPNKIFTADSNIIEKCVGKINDSKFKEVTDEIIKIIKK